MDWEITISFGGPGTPSGVRKFFLVAEWLFSHLEKNHSGLSVSDPLHWEYRTLCSNPGIGDATGAGISVLVRAYKESGNRRYLEAAELALASFFKSVAEGGVISRTTAATSGSRST